MATMTVAKTLAKTTESAWKNKKAEDLAFLDWFIKTRQKNIPITDDEIQEMVDEVRYGNK
jgi:ferritin